MKTSVLIVDARPTGRLTFTTWHHWNKDSTLLDSGLLSLVTVNFGSKINAIP